jgi:hypothetical protein
MVNTQTMSLRQIERATKLPKRVLNYMKNDLIGPALINKYAAVLYILSQGFNALNTTFSFDGKPSYTVDDKLYDYVKNVVARAKFGYQKQGVQYEEVLLGYLQKTPGWKQMSGEYEEPINDTKVGMWGFQLPLMPNNPASGPDQNVPPLCEQLLNKIHPEFTQNLENFCNLIRQRAYLALPAMAFGSLQRVVASINGVVVAFQKIIGELYQRVIRLIKQFYTYINGKINEIKRWIMWLIEQIIPIDILCLILEATQVLLDDINFFTSLFSQSGSIFSFLNQFQNYINIASNFLSNPLSTLESFIPADVLNIINLVEQIGTDPNGFITDQLTNYGYYWAAEALQGNLVAALVDKFGPQFRAVGPIATLISASGLDFAPAAQSISPSWTDGSDEDPVVDMSRNPVDGLYKIVKQTGKNVSSAVGDLGASVNNLGESLKAEGDYIKKIPKKLSNALDQIF